MSRKEEEGEDTAEALIRFDSAPADRIRSLLLTHSPPPLVLCRLPCVCARVHLNTPSVACLCVQTCRVSERQQQQAAAEEQTKGRRATGSVAERLRQSEELSQVNRLLLTWLRHC